MIKIKIRNVKTWIRENMKTTWFGGIKIKLYLCTRLSEDQHTEKRESRFLDTSYKATGRAHASRWDRYLGITAPMTQDLSPRLRRNSEIPIQPWSPKTGCIWFGTIWPERASPPLMRRTIPHSLPWPQKNDISTTRFFVISTERFFVISTERSEWRDLSTTLEMTRG